MAKKGKDGITDENSSSVDLSGANPAEGISTTGDENVEEKAPGDVKKKGWAGPIENRWTKGRINEKPSELLLAFRKVYRGNLSTNDLGNPSIQTVMQLKLEDNAKFLTEFRTLSKDHQERVAKKRESVARLAADSASSVAKDQKTEDLLLLIDELIADCEKAAVR